MSALVAESQVSEALNVGTKAVRLRAINDSWPVKKIQKQGGSELFFIRDLLPLDVQKNLVVRESIESATGKVIVHDTPVPSRSKNIGLAKYNLVHAYRLAKKQAPWGEKLQAGKDFLLAYNAGLLLPQVFDQIGEIRARTLDNLDQRLREHNDDYLCLCDGRGGWKKHGTTKYKGRQLSEAAKAVFLKCYLHGSRPSVKMAVRAARITLEKEGEPVPASESTFRRWLRDYEKFNAGVICLARDGMKAYHDKYAPYITRDVGLLEVGQCLVADGKTLNFFIRHPETGRPCRMTLLVFFDWASRYPAGWQILPTENQWGILSAFRNAVQTLGKYPQSVYLDNGRAFKSQLFCGDGRDMDFEEMTGLYARVGTAVMFAKPYNGRSKVVERFFGTVQGQLEFMMPSYCGDSITTKPPWMHRNEKIQKAWHQARTQGWMPDVREASIILDRYFNWYAQQPQKDLQAAPADLFLPGRGPGVDIHQLNYDFMWRKTVRPDRCRVTLWGISYESDCLQNLDRQTKIQVRANTADLSRIYCYTMDGFYLGDALPVQACHPLARLFGDQVSIDQVAAANKRQNRVIKNARRQLTELGVTKESQGSLDIMPFKTAAPVVTRNQATADTRAPAAEIPDKEIKRLERLTDKAQAERDVVPQVARPKYWESDLDHYEWCFKLIYEHGQAPCSEDKEFMNTFESQPEFRQYRQRFEDLKLIYN